MMTRLKARSMINRLIPERGVAVLTLNPDTNPESVTIYNAWIKPTGGGMKNYGGITVEQDKTIINIPDIELNPAGNGREIQSGDEIVFDGVTYVITSAGSALTTVRTVWACNVQIKIRNGS